MADIGAILDGIIGLLDTTVEVAIGLVEEVSWASYRLGIEPIVSVLYSMVSCEISPTVHGGGKSICMRGNEITFKSHDVPSIVRPISRMRRLPSCRSRTF